MDFGLISLKDRDSYAKITGRSGMRGFWPLDLDLRAINRSAQDLIVAVQIKSGGSKLLARGAAARHRRGRIPWRGIAGESETGATVLGLDCGLDVEVHQGTRNPLGRLAGFGGVLRGSPWRRAVLARRRAAFPRLQGLQPKPN